MAVYSDCPVRATIDTTAKTITLTAYLPPPDAPSWARPDGWYPQLPQTVSSTFPIGKTSTSPATAIYTDIHANYFLTTYNSTSGSWSFPGQPCDSNGNLT